MLVSAFLSSSLDLAKEELRSSWWTRVRRYRYRSTGHGTSREKHLLLSEGRTRAAGGGEVKTGEEEL